MKNRGEIVLYHPEVTIELEVRIEDETVWLNRHQLSELFKRDIKTIGKHINNALKEELKDLSVVANFATTASDGKLIEHGQKIDFFVRTTLPPVEGIFYDGQLFDAYKFASDQIRTATKSIILIDNYIDDSVLMLLTKRKPNVAATIYTAQISKQLAMDIQKHNSQYPSVDVRQFKQSHDRFFIIDNKDIYHIGASLKDLGKNGLPSLNYTSI